jgi:hypothetical protein
MQIIGLVEGVALIGAGGVAAIQQLVMLARRYRSVGALQLVALPAGSRFRVSLLFIAQGVLLLQQGDRAGQWTVIGLWVALVGWHSALWLRRRLRRRRPAAQ